MIEEVPDDKDGKPAVAVEEGHLEGVSKKVSEEEGVTDSVNNESIAAIKGGSWMALARMNKMPSAVKPQWLLKSSTKGVHSSKPGSWLFRMVLVRE